jgi:hypothetical protein
MLAPETDLAAAARGVEGYGYPAASNESQDFQGLPSIAAQTLVLGQRIWATYPGRSSAEMVCGQATARICTRSKSPCMLLVLLRVRVLLIALAALRPSCKLAAIWMAGN